jgi:hypothetical protein
MVGAGGSTGAGGLPGRPAEGSSAAGGVLGTQDPLACTGGSTCLPDPSRAIEPLASPCGVIEGPAIVALGKAKVARHEEKHCSPYGRTPQTAVINVGQEALVVEGPAITMQPGLCEKIGASFSALPSADGFRPSSGEGLRVNDRLRYSMSADDFDGELSIGKVELYERNGLLASRFFLVAVKDGDLSNLLIGAAVDGVVSMITPPSAIQTLPRRTPDELACATETTLSPEEFAALHITGPYERRCHPLASDRAFVFLGSPHEAVSIAGPAIPWPAGRCHGDKLTIRQGPFQPDPMDPANLDIDVTGVPGLRLRLESSGRLGDAITLVQVRLFERRGLLESEFVFVGRRSINGYGQLFMRAFVDDQEVFGGGEQPYIEAKW